MSLHREGYRTSNSVEVVVLSMLAWLSVTAIFDRLGRLFARHANGENVDAEIIAYADELSRRRVGTDVKVEK